jgi:hypothetical protein
MRLVAALFLLALSQFAYGEPAFVTDADGARITLHTDKCSMKEVKNLPFKATWEEKGKVFQGCWGPRPDAGLIVFYFDDRTVGIAPMQAFVKVTNS